MFQKISLNLRKYNSLVLSAFVLLFVFLFLTLFLNKHASALPTPDKIKVIEVRYFPNGEQDVIYHPDTLSQELQGHIREASKFHGYSDPSATPSVEVEVVGVYNRQGARPNPDGTWQSTYNAILSDGDLCNVINTQGIDQVWLWVDPRVGYDPGPGVEYAISSNYFQTGAEYATVANPAFCGGQRSFLFMGFDTTRPSDNALHSFGHMMEGVIGNVQSVDLFWYGFSGIDEQGYPHADRCGNVHFPPNGTSDYNYSNMTSVTNSCEDWNPALTGAQSTYDCTKWGCTQLGFLKWWLQNIPNDGNTLTYKQRTLPSWWEFTQNIDQNIQTYSSNPDYFINRAFLGTTACDVTTGTSLSANQLGVTHTGCGSNDNFLAALVSYRAVLGNTTHKVSTMTYNGSNMTFGCRANSNEYATEVWYFNDPVSTGGNVDMTWTLGNAASVVANVQTFKNIADINPVASAVCNSDGGAWSTDPIGKNPEVTIGGGEGYVAFGGMTTYPANLNVIKLDNDFRDEWNKKITNVISAGTSKLNTSASNTLAWTGSVNWPWSAAALSLRTNAVNQAPVLNAISNQSIVAGQTFNYDANAVDPNPSDTLTYSLTQAPTGMSINSSNGIISWPTTNANVGTHPVSVKAQDGGSLSDTKSFTLTVQGPGIDFDGRTFVSYGGTKEDKAGTAVVSNFGYTYTITGNRWKAVSYPYTVTANTVLEFDFQSSVIGEVHGIGLENDLNTSANRVFKLYGTENWGLTAFNNYAANAPTVKHYVIPIGQYYTGSMNYLVFVNDHDINNPTGQSVFSNIKIYQSN